MNKGEWILLGIIIGAIMGNIVGTTQMLFGAVCGGIVFWKLHPKPLKEETK